MTDIHNSNQPYNPSTDLTVLAEAGLGVPVLAAVETRRLSTTARAIGRLVLRIVAGPDAGKELVFELGDGQGPRVLRGGRSAVNDIVLDDEHVSSTHFELVLAGGRSLLRDLDSTNGLVIGQCRIREAWLAPEITFHIGATAIQVVAADPVDIPLPLVDHFGELYGCSTAMRDLFRTLGRFAERGDRLPLLITGETGTGKELVARGMHQASARRQRPFVVCDCTTIAHDLAESHLFGHARGAFTGAITDQRGVFETADGGTLFLDEIGELPLPLQSKLLRVLQEGTVTRLGEHTPRRVDVRVICATHRDLKRMVAADLFRQDLYFRIAGLPVHLPPLRERESDVVFLAELFLGRLMASQRRVRRLTEDAALALRSYAWPGNVRELRSAIERGFYVSDDEWIRRADLGLGEVTDAALVRGAVELQPLLNTNHVDALAGFERIYFNHLLDSYPTKAQATRASGMTGEGFRLALRRLNIRQRPR